MKFLRRSGFILPVAILLFQIAGGCAVGPNFAKPAPPEVSEYTAKPLPSTTSSTDVPGGKAQHFVKGADVSGEWWTLFHSKALSALIERSLKANPNIKAAQAALKVARENALAQRGAFFPSITGSFAGSQNKTSAVIAPVPSSNALYYNLYTPQVAVSYVPDVFGLNRRTVESLDAQTEAQRFQLAATYITLSSNVAAAAIQEASLRGQIDATHRLIDINKKMLDVLRKELAAGYVGRLDVAAVESQLAQVIATLPPLEKQLAQQRDLLAALSGGFAANGPGETFALSSMELPGTLPVSLPSKLVEQRPDVRQAEENLRSASAQIGVAVANRLPNFTLTANAGSNALSIGQIFAPGAGFFALGQTVSQPIFQGGTLLHRERAARAAYTQAAEQYRSTVLTAFQNVADTLVALEQDADALKAAAEAEHASKVSLDLVTRQLNAGYVNYLALLNAEQSYQQALTNLVQAQANRYSDTAALFLALGGGWWNRPEATVMAN
jgi:NodT family efflux transporter outer membrane factor (OMF) lipoprotein